MWGVVDCGCRIARGLACCHSASMLVLLYIHVLCSIEHLPVVAILAVVVLVGIVAFAVAVCIHQVLF